MFGNIIVQLLIIFGVILVGYFSTRRGLWPFEMNRMMTRFVLNVSCPLIIIASVTGEGVSFEHKELVQLIYVSLILYAVLLLSGYLVTAVWRLDVNRRGLVRFVTTFGNVTFVGYPVLMALFGQKAVFYASVLTIPFNLLMFSFGTLFVKGEGRLRELLSKDIILSPCIIASAVAFVIAYCDIDFPSPVGVFCHLIGDMTIPCALILAGSTLTCISARDMIGNAFIYKTIFMRLLFAPMLVVLVLLIVPCDPMVRSVAIVLSGMPSAANGIMFCLQYNRSEHDMAQCIFLSALWSIVTIPFLLFIIEKIYVGC